MKKALLLGFSVFVFLILLPASPLSAAEDTGTDGGGSTCMVCDGNWRETSPGNCSADSPTCKNNEPEQGACRNGDARVGEPCAEGGAGPEEERVCFVCGGSDKWEASDVCGDRKDLPECKRDDEGTFEGCINGEAYPQDKCRSTELEQAGVVRETDFVCDEEALSNSVPFGQEKPTGCDEIAQHWSDTFSPYNPDAGSETADLGGCSSKGWVDSIQKLFSKVKALFGFISFFSVGPRGFMLPVTDTGVAANPPCENQDPEIFKEKSDDFVKSINPAGE